MAPNDGGTVFGAAMLAESLGKTLSPLPVEQGQPVFFGPPVTTIAIEVALPPVAAQPPHWSQTGCAPRSRPRLDRAT